MRGWERTQLDGKEEQVEKYGKAVKEYKPNKSVTESHLKMVSLVNMLTKLLLGSRKEKIEL